MNVSVIIVNFNTSTLLRNCLNSIYKHTHDVQYEIIVVDNASIDGSVDMIRTDFPDVILIESDKNLGFGRANNLAVKKARGKYLFFLNSDCLLLDNSILFFFNYYEKNNILNNIGCIGGQLIDVELKPNSTFQKFPEISATLLNRVKYIFSKITYNHLNLNLNNHINYKDINSDAEVDFVVGADMIIPTKTFKLLHGFDEQFFLYFEETDIQKRMSERGLKRIILAESKIIHLEGSSSKKNGKSLSSINLFMESQIKYFKKHEKKHKYFMFRLLIVPLFFSPLISFNYSVNEKLKFVKVLFK